MADAWELMGMGARRLDWARDGADWPNRDASRFVEAGGLRWHVQVMGSGPVALLLHGTGGATHSWRAFAPLLAADFTVVAPDLPGHGFTAAARPSQLSPPGMAAGVAALTDALGARPDLIVAHSAGAAVAVRMALEGRVDPRAIVAFNGAFLPFRGAAGRLFPTMARLLALNPAVPRAVARGADSAAVDRLMRGVGSALDPAGRALYRRLFASPGHVEAALGMMAAWELKGLAPAMASLRPRLTLAVGEVDRAVPPSDAREVAARVPGARVVVMPGLGHLAHEERPADAAAVVRAAWADANG
jgi:magnesium chelatase accessory protein